MTARPSTPGPLCGVDTGGTFTDVVADDGRVLKVLSDPGDTASPVRDGVAAFPRPRLVAHGHFPNPGDPPRLLAHFGRPAGGPLIKNR